MIEFGPSVPQLTQHTSQVYLPLPQLVPTTAKRRARPWPKTAATLQCWAFHGPGPEAERGEASVLLSIPLCHSHEIQSPDN